MRTGSEFKWILEGYTPDTLPMARLSEYMQQLAALLGQQSSVHFVRIDKKCVSLVSKVDGILPSQKVRERVAGVRSGKAPRDAVRAFEAMNVMVADDGGSALLKQGGATIIRFPGSKFTIDKRVEINDLGSVVGQLYMLAQSRDGFQARIRPDRNTVLFCAVNADMARKMKGLLFGPVRAFGRGLWRRESAGHWAIVDLDILDVVPVEDRTLRHVIDEIRDLDIEWSDDPLGYLSDINEESGLIQ